MPPIIPALIYKPDNDPSFHATGAWYCSLPGADPGGYSTRDTVSGPSAGDVVVMKEWTRAPAARAYRAIQASRTPDLGDLMALYLHLHEFCHTEEPDHSDVENGKLTQAQFDALVDYYGHPSTPLAAIIHAFRRRLPINAFTRLLRWRRAPIEGWNAGLKWFGAQLAVMGKVTG